MIPAGVDRSRPAHAPATSEIDKSTVARAFIEGTRVQDVCLARIASRSIGVCNA